MEQQGPPAMPQRTEGAFGPREFGEFWASFSLPAQLVQMLAMSSCFGNVNGADKDDMKRLVVTLRIRAYLGDWAN